ncbi:hypothetical protein FJU30_08220 [Affinibrenneria salicis]|uniref:Uncharacterized protein n=1 Tax=Affinibrenneria salicis TaxID=2590031 RepID=A0A5J5G348_9GAMM|nr:hypothetical protein [Affinibrenneria salicis]KAA9001216.1 hypothetical protein FJU30_08220 [Affinibrenneria salicis]
MKKLFFMSLFCLLISPFTVAEPIVSRGVLQAYWQAEWNDDATVNTPRLGFRFFSDAKSSLQGKAIDVFVAGGIEQQQAFIRKNFRNIPDNFFSYKEWYVNQPGTVEFAKVKKYVECNADNYSADILSFKPDLSSKNNAVDESLASCGYSGRYPYLTLYQAKPEGKTVWFKASPDDNAGNTFSFSEEDTVAKIKTINQGWIYAAVYDESQKDSLSEKKGYIRLTELQPLN